jgi:hypothetical protein
MQVQPRIFRPMVGQGLRLWTIRAMHLASEQPRGGCPVTFQMARKFLLRPMFLLRVRVAFDVCQAWKIAVMCLRERLMTSAASSDLS